MEDGIWFVFRDDNFRYSERSGAVKTEKFATMSGCNLFVSVYNYIWMVGIDKSCQLWVCKKKTKTESAFVLYCNYSNHASTGIPTLLPFLDRNAVFSGWITARTAQALEEWWHRGIFTVSVLPVWRPGCEVAVLSLHSFSLQKSLHANFLAKYFQISWTMQRSSQDLESRQLHMTFLYDFCK